jgi:hypothetical protein
MGVYHNACSGRVDKIMGDAYTDPSFYTADGLIDYENSGGKRTNPNQNKYGKPVPPARSGEQDSNAYNR